MSINNDNLGYIYIIKNEFDDKIKIGSTLSYEKRYYQYKTYSPFEWKYIRVYKINKLDIDDYTYEDKYDYNNINCYNIDDIIQEQFNQYLTFNCYKDCINGGKEWYCNKDDLVSKIDLFLSDETKFNIIKLNQEEITFNNFKINKEWSNLDHSVLTKYLLDFNMVELEHKKARRTREYQKSYITKCFDFLMKFMLCLLVAPTGAGKTFMFYAIARKILRQKRKEKGKDAVVNIVILSPRLSINEQTVSAKNRDLLSINNDFIKINGVDYKDSCKKYDETIKENKKINFIISSTYQSIKKLEQFIKKNKIQIDLVIFDECHFIKSYEKEINENISFIMKDEKYIKKRLFCSATPYNSQRENKGLYGKVVEEVRISDLIKQGYLCPIKTIFKDFKGDTNLSKLVIKEIKDKNKKKIIIFCNTQKNCRSFYNKIKLDLQNENIKPYLYISDKSTKDDNCIYEINLPEKQSEKDKKIIKDFEKENEISIIITCKRISMGYDFPKIDMVVFADAKCEKIDIAQCIGRGLRTIKDNPKKECHVLLPVCEEDITISKFKTIQSYFDYLKEECGYNIFDNDIWNSNSKSKTNSSELNKNQADYYGFDIEVDFNDNSLKTRVIDICCKNKIKYKNTSEIIDFCKKNNITSYNEYDKFINSSKNKDYPDMEYIKNKKDFYWKKLNNKKYYKKDIQCITKIRKIDKTFNSDENDINKFIEYNKKDSKIPPMTIKDYYGVYCRDIKKCFKDNLKLRHVLKSNKTDIWEAIYNRNDNSIFCKNNKKKYQGKSPLNIFAKEHKKKEVNAWNECDYYCEQKKKWISTQYMSPL